MTTTYERFQTTSPIHHHGPASLMLDRLPGGSIDILVSEHGPGPCVSLTLTAKQVYQIFEWYSMGRLPKNEHLALMRAAAEFGFRAHEAGDNKETMFAQLAEAHKD